MHKKALIWYFNPKFYPIIDKCKIEFKLVFKPLMLNPIFNTKFYPIIDKCKIEFKLVFKPLMLNPISNTFSVISQNTFLSADFYMV